METNRARIKLYLWVLSGFGVAVFIAGYLFLGKDLPPQLPLWYSRPWGETQLTDPKMLGLLPALAIGITLVTNLLLNKLKKLENWLFIFGWSGIVAVAILDLALLRIWMLAF